MTEQGSLTYHSAIVARELGIPAIVAAAAATTYIRTGDWVIVDGDQGKVTAPIPELEPPRFVLPRPVPSPLPRDRPAIRTQLLVNLSHTRTLKHVAALPVAGIGLVRSELWMLTLLDYQHPNLWVQRKRETELVALLAEGIDSLRPPCFPGPCSIDRWICGVMSSAICREPRRQAKPTLCWGCEERSVLC